MRCLLLLPCVHSLACAALHTRISTLHARGTPPLATHPGLQTALEHLINCVLHARLFVGAALHAVPLQPDAAVPAPALPNVSLEWEYDDLLHKLVLCVRHEWQRLLGHALACCLFVQRCCLLLCACLLVAPPVPPPVPHACTCERCSCAAQGFLFKHLATACAACIHLLQL